MSNSIRNVGATRFGVNGSTGASPRTPAVGPLGGAGPRQPLALESLSRCLVDLGVPPPLTWEVVSGEVPAVRVAADTPSMDPTPTDDLGEPAVSERPDDGSERPRVANKPSLQRSEPDRFERAAKAAASPPARPAKAATSEHAVTSPFVEVLARGANTVAALPSTLPTSLPPLAPPQADPGAAAHLPYSQLGQLGAVAGTLAASGSPAPRRIYLGSMLVMTDAQRHDLPGLEPMATVILRGNLQATSEHFARWLRSSDRVLAAAQQNVAALVQQVLRESYLMTTDVLRDYAEKVQFYNEQKKKVRELLEKARTTRAAWAQQAQALPPDSIFVGDPPFECRDINPVTGEVVTPTMTNDDVARWKSLDEARKRAAPATPLDQMHRLNGATGLSAADVAVLDEMLSDKDGGGFMSFSWADSKNDNYLCDHIDELTALIPKMNKDDISKYLPPIVDTLTGGNTDEGELLSIFNALSPVQYLFLFSGGFDPSKLDNATFNDDVKSGAKRGAWLGAVTSDIFSITLGGASMGGLLGGLLSDNGGFDGGEMAELDLIGKKAAIAVAEASGSSFSGELTRERAAQLLAGLAEAAQKRERDAAGQKAPAAGDPKAVRSTEELDAYIKSLEEKLSGLGDDAQLANVDLQNELQKQQQTLQMMSNISKTLHDTAMAVVRKIGG